MKKSSDNLQVPFDEKKVLLHTCCAPCSSAIIEHLLSFGIEPVIYYCNPNIYPFEEYQIRKNECTRYAESLGLTIIDADYDHDAWLKGVKGMEDEPERGGRCLKCFRMRLLDTAEYASRNGYRVITTTLASSRWKSLDQINEAGTWACEMVSKNTDHGCNEVVWWDKNWRKGGLQERRNQIIKEYGFYNQLWCGCEFSRKNLG
jgi:predicted adenine nucleotide alpha hydrolase (AANH) superfamily ATPase